MNANLVLKSVLKRLNANHELSAFNTGVFNHVPAEQSPPYLEVQVISCNRAIGQQTASTIVDIKVVSAYRGDAELESLVAAALQELTPSQPFKTADNSTVMQGRLLNRERRVGMDGRTKLEHMQLIFFISPCN
jgi:hypothetical protein